MAINEKWSGTSDKCPVCLTSREDDQHHLKCQSNDMVRKRDEFLGNFEMDLIHFNTYPPLQEFLMEFFEKVHVHEEPLCPDTVDPRYIVELQLAFEDQNAIGWHNFARGMISKRWRHLQLCFLYNNENKDMYAVDKWTRMLIKNILEYNRVLWGERCDVVHAETDCTCQDRQRQEIFNLCQYLRRHKHLIPEQDHHFLNKDHSFFFRRPIENVLNWEKRMIISLQPTKDKKSRDIRGYMITTENDEINNDLPNQAPARKRPHTDNTIQSTLTSFVISSHSLSNSNRNTAQPNEKKQRLNKLTQTTLLDSFTIDSQINSIPPSSISTNIPKRTITPSPDDRTGFKRRRLASPMSTSKKRMDSLGKNTIKKA